MELQSTITRENLEELVTLFYHGAMKDEQIGHYFLLELGEDITNYEWTKHIDILVDFWARVFLDDPLYDSDPYGPHFTIIGLSKADFDSWVKLFSESADKIYVPEVANLFKEKGRAYSEEFMQRLKVTPEISDYYHV